MEQTALRPKPMPGREPADGTTSRPSRRPHAARRRGRRLTTLLFGLFIGTVLVLAGVGLGTLGATVIGLSKLAELQRQAGQGGGTGQPGEGSDALGGTPAEPGAGVGSRSGSASGAGPAKSPSGGASPASAPPAVTATLGLEAVDAVKAGALLVGVHVPGPGYTAGLVRGDVLLAFGGTRIDSAADLARAVGHARPGAEITLTVRHRGGYQQLVVVPGVVT
ncbi:PDZ domain-containing protein [Streptomyces sp. ME02-8801-2C]|uniref:PDZ domain-containing protein n=1 Tax=Streptomyces sp. ME02-8801-2C TaxID=3028680 RepID=UPI0029BBD2C0|nr:PDZ domain-containing protein [Streptomyces sp. ME02-8801-2C]MDX3451072.1 PDZ domain-containing protein [Streptomyces sp. ME02-8801-2C]